MKNNEFDIFDHLLEKVARPFSEEDIEFNKRMNSEKSNTSNTDEEDYDFTSKILEHY